jgi:hypothetical protein
MEIVTAPDSAPTSILVECDSNQITTIEPKIPTSGPPGARKAPATRVRVYRSFSAPRHMAR